MQKTLQTISESAKVIDIVVNYEYINPDIADDDYLLDTLDNVDIYYVSSITSVLPEYQQEIAKYYDEIANEIIDEL